VENVYGILDFGGNIMTIGTKADGSLWNIGITNPLDTTEVYAAVSVNDKCVVTSGNYERYFIEDGVRYHHILNPFTGYPAESGIISSTIIGDNSTQCDALSTACYIMGVDKALELIEKTDGVEAVFIDNDGEVHTSSGIEKYSFRIIQ
jgi:thiamine biosynthesis lipoprotein